MFPSRYITAAHVATGYAKTHPHAAPTRPVATRPNQPPAPATHPAAMFAALVAKLRRR